MDPSSDNPTPVILVGRSPVEQSLRRDPTLEMVRAPGLLNAIGELASIGRELEGAPVVIFTSEAQRSGDLARCIESLRVVDARVKIVGVRARDNGTPAPPPSPHIGHWIDDDASGQDLRATLAPDPSIDPALSAAPDDTVAIQSRPSTEAPSPSAAPSAAPSADDDRSIVDALLAGRDVAAICVGILQERIGSREIELHEGEAPPAESAQIARSPVDHAGHRFGWLTGPADRASRLESAAPWLASWLALARQQSQLRTAALTDPLTGAWNRRYFDRYLGHAIDRARERRHDVSLLLFDIDDFKTYNDRYGHAAGDEILCETVRLLQSIIRPTDRVARIGGDEFAVIFDSPEGPRDPSTRQPLRLFDIARRFQQRIRTHQFPKLGEEALGILSVSGGMATFPWDAGDAQSLVEAADELILSSKSQGKNLICFGPGAQRVDDCPSQTQPESDAGIGEK